MFQLALLGKRAQRFQAVREAFSGDVDEIAVDGEARRNFELRERSGNFFQPQAAAFGDVERARENLGRIFEDAIHFVVALDEELRAFEFQACGVANRLPRLDAEHHILRVSVVFAQIVAVIGRDQRQAKIFLQLEQAGMDFVFHGKALILNFEKEVFLAENIGIASGGGASGGVVPFHQAFRDFALQASGEPNQAPGVFRQKLFADARFVVKAVQRGFRSDFDEVAVAFFVFGQNQQVVVGIAFGRGAVDVVIVFLADVEFAANNGLHAGGLRGIDEMHGAKNISVVGHGHGGHAHFLYPLA